MQLCAKNHQNLMRGFEDIGSKGNFLAKNHIMSPQAMYLTQKWPKQPKQEFSQAQHCHSMIQSNCPKFLTKFQTNLMCGFEENVQKPDFLAKNGQKWQKLAVFGQKRPNENFFQKSAWNIFLVSSRCSFVQKIIKI